MTGLRGVARQRPGRRAVAPVDRPAGDQVVTRVAGGEAKLERLSELAPGARLAACHRQRRRRVDDLQPTGVGDRMAGRVADFEADFVIAVIVQTERPQRLPAQCRRAAQRVVEDAVTVHIPALADDVRTGGGGAAAGQCQRRALDDRVGTAGVCCRWLKARNRLDRHIGERPEVHAVDADRSVRGQWHRWIDGAAGGAEAQRVCAGSAVKRDHRRCRELLAGDLRGVVARTEPQRENVVVRQLADDEFVVARAAVYGQSQRPGGIRADADAVVAAPAVDRRRHAKVQQVDAVEAVAGVDRQRGHLRRIDLVDRIVVHPASERQALDASEAYAEALSLRGGAVDRDECGESAGYRAEAVLGGDVNGSGGVLRDRRRRRQSRPAAQDLREAQRTGRRVAEEGRQRVAGAAAGQHVKSRAVGADQQVGSACQAADAVRILLQSLQQRQRGAAEGPLEHLQAAACAGDIDLLVLPVAARRDTEDAGASDAALPARRRQVTRGAQLQFVGARDVEQQAVTAVREVARAAERLGLARDQPANSGAVGLAQELHDGVRAGDDELAAVARLQRDAVEDVEAGAWIDRVYEAQVATRVAREDRNRRIVAARDVDVGAISAGGDCARASQRRDGVGAVAEVLADAEVGRVHDEQRVLRRAERVDLAAGDSQPVQSDHRRLGGSGLDVRHLAIGETASLQALHAADRSPDRRVELDRDIRDQRGPDLVPVEHAEPDVGAETADAQILDGRCG